MTPYQAFGERLAQARREKAARERRDIFQKEIAAAVGTTPTTVSRWEKGISIPESDTLMMKLADFLGVTPAWLRYGEGNGTGAPKLPLREPQRPLIPRRKGKGQ